MLHLTSQMAIVQPSLGDLRSRRGGEWREHQLLCLLERGLPDTYQVFHGLNYSSVRSGHQSFGELDAVVLAPNGSLVILEVQAGSLQISDTGVHKKYGIERKDVLQQIQRQRESMRIRLREAGWGNVHIAHFLVLPDVRVVGDTLACPRERIIDSEEQGALCSKVREASAVQWGALTVAELDRLRHFLLGQFDLQPDPSARVDQLNQSVRIISDGLANWVPRITHPSGQFQIQATAGSGKTQLALRLLADAAQSNLRARYVCFNRVLADHLARVASPRVEVLTFHQLAWDCWERQFGATDFHDAAIFQRMAQHYAAWVALQEPSLDLLIVDESQDFESDWVESLTAALRSDGKLYLMGDDDQALYERAAPELVNAITIHVDENFRTPGAIVETINLLGLATQTIKARSPFKGEAPGFHLYNLERDAGGMKATCAVVDALLNDGFQLSQIVLLTLRSKVNSVLLSATQLGPYSLRTFTGRYDSAGNALWTDGELLADTVMRFKGCAAPVVVVCGLEFSQLDDATRRKLFVAFTRAQYRLECVLTATAEQALVAAVAAGAAVTAT